MRLQQPQSAVGELPAKSPPALKQLSIPATTGGGSQSRWREVARSTPVGRVGTVAERADTAIFSSAEPSDDAAEALWVEVDGVREELLEPMSRSERIRTMVSINSLRTKV